jgi:hypothetical protein
MASAKTRSTRIKVLLSQRFGKLTVKYELSGTARRRFVLACDCGNEHASDLGHLTDGSTHQCRACSCKQQGKSITTHGHTNMPGYAKWSFMIARCYDPDNIAYHNYGKRGIRVCNSWRKSFESFQGWFLKQPEGHYGPDNCRLITRSQNSRNQRSNLWIDYKGEKRLLVDLWEKYGVADYAATVRRYRNGWSVEDILGKPVRPKATHGVTRKPDHTISSKSRARTNSKLFKHDGRMWALTDLWEAYGKVSYTTARARVRMGWEVMEALSIPAGGASRAKKSEN